ncbi:hypothetical protein SAMN05421503_1315 [Terribacillus aidingensis]|uniref:Coupling factor for flagellin transcription and translation n=1 Tax=Terribacillus aidingensis TaxID=586416 RepID=A0A285NJN0_9BACI|nr:hypothetical protein [Terribacillus aidingensis]SNZ09702.1 hypothetical protein SAMN05421503_1315 [Terribacillus aidingensis]
MLTLLVAASLLLHLLTFIAIRTLQSNVQQQESRHKKEKQAYESILNSILDELKEENERLLQAEQVNEKVSVNTRKQETTAVPAAYSEKEAEEAPHSADYAPPQLEEEKDQVSMSNLSRVLQLHEQHHAPAEIAKKLGMGKTEVELILLMRKNGNTDKKS